MQRWNGDLDDRPVEYMVLKFPNGYMSEDVGDEILWLSIMRVIRLLDFVLLTKDDVGMVSMVELNELSQMGGFSDIEGRIRGLIDQQDIDLVSDRLDEGSAAALMIVEDLWATSLSEALNRSGAHFLERSPLRYLPPPVREEECLAVCDTRQAGTPGY